MNPIDFLKAKSSQVKDAIASAPGNLVRADKFQKGRDFLMNVTGVPEPEKRFVQAMTGGLNEGITELPDKFIGPIKGAFNEKLEQQKLFGKAQAEFDANPEKYEQTYFDASKGVNKEVTTPGHVGQVLAGKDFYGDSWSIPKGIFKQPHEGEGVSFYGSPRDLHLSLGHANVTKDDQGNYRLTDTWDVDHDPELVLDSKTGKPKMDFVPGAGMNLYSPEHDQSGDYMPSFTGNVSESQKDYSDLQEGGRLASTLYNLARKFGTYEPLQYDVTIPAEQWDSAEAISPLNHYPNQGKDIQPAWVKGVNKVISPSPRR